MITNKLVCLFFVLMHFVGGLASLISYHSVPSIKSEGMVCRFVYPLEHFTTFLTSMAMVVFYLTSMISANSVETQEFFKNVKNFGIILILLSSYHLYLKFLSDLNCNFWNMPWNTVIGSTLCLCLEGCFILVFFKWYHSKISMLKSMMVSSAKYLS